MNVSPIFSYFEEPEPGKKEGKDPRFYSIFGVRRKELSSKRRRGLIRRSLKSSVLKTTKTRNLLKELTKVRKSKKEAKPELRYFFEVHKVIRRRRL